MPWTDCEGTLRKNDPFKIYFFFATLCADTLSHTCSRWIPPVHSGRSHKVCLWTQFQLPLQGMDGGQAGKWRADIRRDTGLQPHPGTSTSLQSRLLQQSTRRLSRTKQGISEIFQGSWQPAHWLCIWVPDAGHSLTSLGSQSQNFKYSLFCKTHNSILPFYFFFLYILLCLF